MKDYLQNCINDVVDFYNEAVAHYNAAFDACGEDAEKKKKRAYVNYLTKIRQLLEALAHLIIYDSLDFEDAQAVLNGDKCINRNGNTFELVECEIAVPQNTLLIKTAQNVYQYAHQGKEYKNICKDVRSHCSVWMTLFNLTSEYGSHYNVSNEDRKFYVDLCRAELSKFIKLLQNSSMLFHTPNIIDFITKLSLYNDIQSTSTELARSIEISEIDCLKKENTIIIEATASEPLHQPINNQPITMQTEVTLPQWLDDYIFKELKATYCRSNCDMTVIDWDKADMLNYLGTYFPRSYVEAYCIFKQYFTQKPTLWADRTTISLFDFCCGTGGEIIGLITAIHECFPHIENIDVVALDGNHHALRLYQQIIEQTELHVGIKIRSNIAPILINDSEDLQLIDELIQQGFDIIISFKAICEFVTKACFNNDNAYSYVIETFYPKLVSKGLMLLEDVTSYNEVGQEWLPTMMNQTLSHYNVVAKNEGYNETFTIKHSQCSTDISKIAWRLITK